MNPPVPLWAAFVGTLVALAVYPRIATALAARAVTAGSAR